eukprot:UN06524
MDGKYCVAKRGSCSFQDKVDNCHNAGAVGIIIMNTGEDFFNIWITDSYDKPVVAVAKSLGDTLVEEEGNGISLTLGKGTGVEQPDPEYSEHDPLVMINMYTGQRESNEDAPFQTVLGWFLNVESDWLYAIGPDGENTKMRVLDMDQSPPTTKGEFDLGIEGEVAIAYQKDKTVMIMGDFWNGSLHLYDIKGSNALNPVKLSDIIYAPCSDTDYMGEYYVHPSQNYVYIVPSIHEKGNCEHVTMKVWDISVPTAPRLATTVDIPEVEDGSSIECMVFGKDDIALICLTSGGISWYDFSDPLKPTPVAWYDFAHHDDTYTYGAFEAEWVGGYTWYVQDRTEHWANLHSFSLTSPEDCT